MTDTATAAIEQLNTAWAEFKSTNEERIKSEAKGVADVLFDLKAAKINDAMDELSAKIKTMEAKAARPAAGADSEQAVEEFKAKVRNWASTGNADGRGPEIKALSIGTNADGGFAVPKVIDLPSKSWPATSRRSAPSRTSFRFRQTTITSWSTSMAQRRVGLLKRQRARKPARRSLPTSRFRRANCTSTQVPPSPRLMTRFSTWKPG